MIAAKDTEVPEDENNLVAIKKMINVWDNKIYALRIYRELKIQRLLDHENVLGIKTILKPINKQSFNEIYVVTELMETDLSLLIKSEQDLSEEHIKFFLY